MSTYPPASCSLSRSVIPLASGRGSAKTPLRRWLLALLLSVLTLIGGCGDEGDKVATAPAALPPSVVAVNAESRPVEEQSEFVGRVVAVEKVELRARVQGFLKERRFTEGQAVKTDEVLFLIEPDQYAWCSSPASLRWVSSFPSRHSRWTSRGPMS